VLHIPLQQLPSQGLPAGWQQSPYPQLPLQHSPSPLQESSLALQQLPPAQPPLQHCEPALHESPGWRQHFGFDPYGSLQEASVSQHFV